MKKRVLFLAAILVAGMTYGQDMMSKKGTPILPKSGDYALGFDANNVLSYFGNVLNNSSSNSINNLDLQNTNTIYGKMFTSDNQAYRAMVRLGFGSTNDKTLVQDLSSTDPNATVEDEAKTSNMNITIGGGIENRRGSGRLQGVYGPMAMITLGSSSTENTYGNELSATNPGTRTTETKAGSTFGIAVGGFGGVEYFFAPKISLGAEIAWTIAFDSTGEGETTTETWNGTAAESTTTKTGSSSSFGLDTRPNGSISMNFYF